MNSLWPLRLFLMICIFKKAPFLRCYDFYLFFIFWGCAACGILRFPHPGTEPIPLWWKHGVLALGHIIIERCDYYERSCLSTRYGRNLCNDVIYTSFGEEMNIPGKCLSNFLVILMEQNLVLGSLSRIYPAD